MPPRWEDIDDSGDSYYESLVREGQLWQQLWPEGGSITFIVLKIHSDEWGDRYDANIMQWHDEIVKENFPEMEDCDQEVVSCAWIGKHCELLSDSYVRG